MARLIDVGYHDFRTNVHDKRIVLWGAGRLASYYIQTFCKDLKIVAIIDRKQDLWGTEVKSGEHTYPVISEEEFKRMYQQALEKDQYVLFITPTVYANEILQILNEIQVYAALDCYMGVLLRRHYEGKPFQFTKGNPKIPKKLHYCWFGGKDIPDHLKRYMESWNKFCPDYEIIRWDESNYDFTKNSYMKEAYKAKKWAFASDYARLDVIYKEGGIYLDTDVELLASLDKVLNDEMFTGFSCNFQIGIGGGFGAVKGHRLIKALRDYYDNLSFYLENGELNMKTCYVYHHPVFQSFGFNLEDQYQKKDGMVLYPSEVLSPKMGLVSENYTENTISVHHFDFSWAGEDEKKAIERLKKMEKLSL